MSNTTKIGKILLGDSAIKTSVNRLWFGDKQQANSTDVASLDARVLAEEVDASTDVSSLNARILAEEVDASTDVSSLNARILAEEVDASTDVSSLDARVLAEEQTSSTNIASFEARMIVEEKTTQAKTIDLTASTDSIDIVFADEGFQAFASAPAVAATIRCVASDGAIILGMLKGSVTATGCTYAFSDTIPNGQYKLDLIATA